MSCTSGIYGIVNLVNDKIYVGSAIKLAYRWKNHRIALTYNKHHSLHLQSAWNLYGPEKFEFKVLEYVENLAELTAREQVWMDHKKAADPAYGYNTSPTAGSCLGVKHTDATKAKLSILRKGKPRSEETKLKVGLAHKGKIVSEETRKKQSLAHIGKKLSDETKAIMSAQRIGNQVNKGRKQSIEHKAAISVARMGHSTSQETRDKISKSNTNRTISEEAKRNMSEAAKRRHSRLDIVTMWVHSLI